MWWLTGCAHRAPTLSPPGHGEQAWESAALVALDDTVVEEHHTLAVAALPGGDLVIRTASTTLVVEGPDGRQAYSSDAPTPADPWPFVLQHAVAAVSARVRADAAGTLHLVEPDAWRDAATDALLRTSLPPAAVDTGLPLVDVVGFEADLLRWFPGTPTGDGTLSRPERLAGVDAVRTETCTVRREDGRRRWRCDGSASDPAGHLREVETWTELVADRHGLVEVASGYGGILASDRGAVPIGGRRVVARREGDGG